MNPDDDSPHQNIPPAPGSELYVVRATVDDPNGANPEAGERWNKEFATIQPNAEAAIKRFVWHCKQMGVIPDPETITARVYDPDDDA